MLHVKIFDALESRRKKVNLQLLNSDGKCNIAPIRMFCTRVKKKYKSY